MAKLDWYFDFISPFSYLQSEQLHLLPADVEIRFKPVLFAGLLNYWDNKGPAEVPPKRIWTYEQCAWLAARHGLPFTLPAYHPFNPLPLLRLCIALGSTRDAVHRLFRYVWQEGRLPSENEHWQALLQQLGVAADMLNTPQIKQQLHDNGEQAIAANVFGVPTAVVDRRCFWGMDSIEMLLGYLGGDPFFQSEQFKAAQNLPQGIQRDQVKRQHDS